MGDSNDSPGDIVAEWQVMGTSHPEYTKLLEEAWNHGAFRKGHLHSVYW